MDQKLARQLAVDEVYAALDEYRINSRKVVFIDSDEKHEGGYGIVRRAHLHASSYLPTWVASLLYGQPQGVAVKEIKLSVMHDASELKEAFTKEVLVWSRLKGHPGVSTFLGFCADFKRKEAWLISPWEQYGNVNEFIGGRELEAPEKLSLVYDTIDALKFLHQLDPPVCHGDIKSANVLVNSECRAVLCDFGLARLYEDSGFQRLETTSESKGSVRWSCRELLNGAPRTATSDMYAWAWLVWEIMTSELPYGDAGPDITVMFKIFASDLPQVDGESRLRDCLVVWELMKRCWSVEPLERPTSAMCKTTFDFLPHFPPNPQTTDPHILTAAQLQNRGEVAAWRADYKAGLAHLDQALELYKQDGNAKAIASVLRKQIPMAVLDLNYAKAMNVASAALDKCRSLKDDIGVADSLVWIASGLMEEGKPLDALPKLQESLKILRAGGDSAGLAKCLERLGELYRRDGLAAQAASTLEESIGVTSRCGARLLEANALISLGATYCNLDHMDQGISAFQRARDIAENTGWEQGLSTCLCRLGSIKTQQDLPLEAEELLREAVRVARGTNGGWRLGQALTQLGICFGVQDRLEECISALEESYSVYVQKAPPSYRLESASTAWHLAYAKSAHGDKEEALTWYDRATFEWRQCGKEDAASDGLREKGDVLVEMGRFDEGALHFEASLIIDQKFEKEDDMRWNRTKLSKIPKTVIKWEVGLQATRTC